MAKNVKPWDIFRKSKPKSGEELIKYRLEICNGCEFLIKPINQCFRCGCFMNIKVKLEDATCPIGKW